MKTKDDLFKDINTLLSANIEKLYTQLGELTYKSMLDEKLSESRYITTSTGHKWLQVPNGYKDLTSGLVWKDKDEDQRHTYGDALAKFRNALPTIEEFKKAELHGLIEVVNLEKTYYWSASINAFYRANAWVFVGANGYVGSSTRTNIYSVRCIAR